ncbi:MAG: histidine phosphatase family protein, partial [Polyangiales bacterium]
MSVLEVCFVRHAQSVSNAAGIWQGHGDSPLSELGRAQVDALRGALSNERYDFALSSDLSRAAETAEALGARLEHDPR